MGKSNLTLKKEAFDLAIKAYKDYKNAPPKISNNKINFELMSDEENDKYFDLVNDIWKAKENYNIELNEERKSLRIDENNFMKKLDSDVKLAPVMDFNNKNLFVLYNKYYFDERFTLVGIKIDSCLMLGLAICSKSDNFSRKIGRELAYKRASNGSWVVPMTLNKPLEIRKYLHILVNNIDENIGYYKQYYV
jgi:hypothetical protein